MTRALRLTVTTPGETLVERDVVSLRAEDESGGFGLLPGCEDMLTVLPASVLRWRDAEGREGCCALAGGVMTATGGARVAVACRQGAVGDDAAKLEAEVRAMRETRADADRRARAEQTRLHARAVRELVRYLRPAPGGSGGPG